MCKTFKTFTNPFLNTYIKLQISSKQNNIKLQSLLNKILKIYNYTLNRNTSIFELHISLCLSHKHANMNNIFIVCLVTSEFFIQGPWLRDHPFKQILFSFHLTRFVFGQPKDKSLQEYVHVYDVNYHGLKCDRKHKHFIKSFHQFWSGYSVGKVSDQATQWTI